MKTVLWNNAWKFWVVAYEHEKMLNNKSDQVSKCEAECIVVSSSSYRYEGQPRQSPDCQDQEYPLIVKVQENISLYQLLL